MPVPKNGLFGIPLSLPGVNQAMACFWFVLLLPWVLAAQSGGVNALVQGKVVDALTGQPLREVKLTLVDMQPMISNSPLRPPLPNVVSDAEGGFLFVRVPPGTYILSAERPGYGRSAYHPDGPRPRGTPFRLEAGQQLDIRNFRLNPNGKVSGRILTPEGQPVPRAVVSLAQYSNTQLGVWLLSKAYTSTDTQGRFALENVLPGEYLLQVLPSSSTASISTSIENRQAQLSPTFYPGVVRPEAAQRLRLAAGQTLDQLDFVMQRRMLLSIRGKVSSPARDLSIVVFPAARSSVPFVPGSPFPVQADGSFTVPALVQGEYSVILVEGRPPQRSVRRVAVKLDSGDIADLQLAYAPPAVLKGKARIEGDAAAYTKNFGTPVDLTQLRLEFQIADGVTVRAMRVASDRQGNFELPDLGLENYRVVAYPLPPGTYLKSMSLGSTNLSTGRVDLRAGITGELELVLSTGVASLAGIVRDANESAVPGVNVGIVKLPFEENTVGRNRRAITDQFGRFVVEGLEPGEYRLFVYRFDPDHDWFTAENWPKVEARTTWVNLREGDSAELTLNLLEAPNSH